MNQQHVWGANYTPRKGWFHSWASLDLGSVENDFATLADLGLDHVRIFPLWPLLQPNRTFIDTKAIDDVLAVTDAAGSVGLTVSVDLLQGHLSSFDFLPAWVSTWHRRNIFTNPDVVSGQHTLARALASELATRTHVSGLTLGNEIGQFAAPRHPERHEITSHEAYEWLDGMLAEVRAAFPRGTHHHCFDDDTWFVDAHPFTPRAAVELGDSTTVHSWIFGGAAQRYGIDAPELPHFARYLLEVADLWHRVSGQPSDRPVWLQEVGAPTPWVSPHNAADFLEGTVRAALGYRNLSGITWWCSHDVSRALADFPDLEYSLGLIDSNGEVKPAGERLRELISLEKAGELSATPTSTQSVIVEGLKADGSNRSLTNTGSDVFGEWMDFARRGEYRSLELG
ncbi:Endo-beta-mannanase [Mycobacteroides abscessus subsp. abscessus]|nr:Endo-beta-mannanase [Mycobacteroides abscessus subsp. abscessus]